MSPVQGCRCWGGMKGWDGTNWWRLTCSSKQHLIAAVGEGALTHRAIPMRICHLKKILSLSLFLCLFHMFWEKTWAYEFALRERVFWLFSQVPGKYHCNDNVEGKKTKSCSSFPALLVYSLGDNHTDSALVITRSQVAASEKLNEISMIRTNAFEFSLQCVQLVSRAT